METYVGFPTGSAYSISFTYASPQSNGVYDGNWVGTVGRVSANDPTNFWTESITTTSGTGWTNGMIYVPAQATETQSVKSYYYR